MILSIVTPSLNQGHYLAETLQSIAEAESIEMIIIDGLSEDHSIDVIGTYASSISYWVSEHDEGQVDAIVKGFAHATGDVYGWLNSDDLLCSKTFPILSEKFSDREVMWITGNCDFIDENGLSLGIRLPEIPKSENDWLNLLVRGKSYPIFQPSTFWRKEVWEKCGPLNDSLDYSFDHEFFLRVFREFGPPIYVNEVLSRFRIHGESKTSNHQLRFDRENRKIGLENLKCLSIKDRMRLRLVHLLRR